MASLYFVCKGPVINYWWGVGGAKIGKSRVQKRGGLGGGGPFGEPPNFIKREKNVLCVYANGAHFST